MMPTFQLTLCADCSDMKKINMGQPDLNRIRA